MASTINHKRLFVQTVTILNTNSLHFLILSLLFRPLIIATTAVIQLNVSSPDITIVFVNLLNLHALDTLLTVITVTVIGIALTTYSTHQAILHQPLSTISTVKSLRHSFIPLLSTFIIEWIKLTVVSLVITLLSRACFHSFIMSYGLLNTGIFYLTIWRSEPVMVVLESTVGLKPLIRKEFRKLSLFMLLLTVAVVGTLVSYNVVVTNMESDVLKWLSVVQVGANNVFLLLMIVSYLVVNTVLYVQCHGEPLDGEVPGEDDYDRFPLHGDFIYMMYVFIVVWLVSLLIGLR